MFRLAQALPALLLLAACSRPAEPAPRPREARAPHGGVTMALGDERIEFVRDRAGGRLDAYVLDDDLERFVRIGAAAFGLTASQDPSLRLELRAVANPATGETVGDTACFSGQADWLKSDAALDLRLTRVEIRGRTYSDVPVRLPAG